MKIHFNLNTQKAIESVIWIINNGESNMYNIWKILFTAEKYHLNKFGRPITGDEYIAMEFGTVPSWLYNASKIKRQGIGFYRDENFLISERNFEKSYFSQSDLQALNYGLSEYKGLSFDQTREKNHKEPAWIKNYNKRGNAFSKIIPFEDIIEEDWLKEDLSWQSHFMVL